MLFSQLSMDNTTPKKDDLGIIFNTTSPEPEKNSRAHTSKESHLTNHGDVFDVTKVFESNHGGEAGTIISDRKRTHASIGSTLGSAFREWWGNARGSVEKSVHALPKITKEEPMIAKASTRTEVVKEAAKLSTIAPKDDHRVVLEQFHTFKSDMARITGTPGITLKQPEKKSIVSRWGHSEPETVIPSHTTETTPASQTYEPIDLRSSMIAPEVSRKIKSDVPVPIPKPFVSQEAPLHKDTPAENAAVIKIAHMSIPDVVPHSSTPVSQEIPHHPAAFVIKEDASKHTEKEISSLPPVQWGSTSEVSLKKDESSLQNIQQETVPSLHTPETTDIHIPAPEVTKHLSASLSPKPRKNSMVEPIQLSTDPHTFPDATIQKESAKRLAPYTQKQSPVPHTIPKFTFTPTTWLILGGIVATGATLAVIVSIYVNVFDSEPVQSHAVPTFIDTETSIGISLTSDAVAFHTIFSEKTQNSGNGNTQVYPTITEGETSRLATSNEFFSTLGITLPRTLSAALDDTFMIGSITTTKPEPYLIIRSYNFDQLFAGLLEWEGAMRTDLLPLFGTPAPTSKFFTDAVQNNKSTRILYDDMGNEILLYSFINQNTVIITTSAEALAALIQEF
jgi:hypothetical protein